MGRSTLDDYKRIFSSTEPYIAAMAFIDVLYQGRNELLELVPFMREGIISQLPLAWQSDWERQINDYSSRF